MLLRKAVVILQREHAYAGRLMCMSSQFKKQTEYVHTVHMIEKDQEEALTNTQANYLNTVRASQTGNENLQ